MGLTMKQNNELTGLFDKFATMPDLKKDKKETKDEKKDQSKEKKDDHK